LISAKNSNKLISFSLITLLNRNLLLEFLLNTLFEAAARRTRVSGSSETFSLDSSLFFPSEDEEGGTSPHKPPQKEVTSPVSLSKMLPDFGNWS
jgi:hypothetical protein